MMVGDPIVDVIGRSRPVDRVYENGAWSCPFCWSAVDSERACEGNAPGYGAACTNPIHCQNPACFANPHYPRERAHEELKKAEAKEAEERRRKADHEWAMKRAAEDARARADKRQAIALEASQRHACARCALHEYELAGRMKFTKHRGPCPLERR